WRPHPELESHQTDFPNRLSGGSEPRTSSDALIENTLPPDDASPLDAEFIHMAEAGGFDDCYDRDGAPVAGSGGARTATTETARDWWDERLERLPAPVSMHESLGEQLRLVHHLDARDRLIGRHLITLLDPVGRLSLSTKDIAARLGVETTVVEKIRILMMGFEPTGLFAHSLQECLAAQLIAQNRFDPAMAAMIDNLDLLGAHEYARVRAICGVDTEDFADMLSELRRLNPKPGFFGIETPPALIADLHACRTSEGNWRVELNPDAAPRLRLDGALMARSLSYGSRSDHAFVRAEGARARWLMRAISQRSRTLLTVGAEIMRVQGQFVDEGPAGLRPLTLQQVAIETGLHESTISRATNGKYIETPHGVIELKYFFTQAVNGRNAGNTQSAEAIRFKIRRMIDNENPGDTLSDDAIVQKLRKEGIDIARRTVAKYRDALRIACSTQRRREKAASV
ncbi:RNA polymerase factor sigma-54, partial [Acetobacter sacchari]